MSDSASWLTVSIFRKKKTLFISLRCQNNHILEFFLFFNSAYASESDTLSRSTARNHEMLKMHKI
jgi:hypothetical protein